MNKKSFNLRVGVAGLRFGSLHIPAFKSIKGIEILAIADREWVEAQKIAEREKIPFVFSDFRELMEQELDIVSFALPPLENEIACTLAIKKRVAIFSEKQLAVSSNKAFQLANLARNLPTALDFQFAELKVFKKLKEFVEKKKLGRVRCVNINWQIETFVQKNKIWSWKADAKKGGGALNVFAPHIFYLIEWLFGPIESIFASTSSEQTKKFAPKSKEPADDLVNLLANHRNGIKLFASISTSSPGINSHRWEIVFDRGTIVLTNVGPDYTAGFLMFLRTEKKERLILKETEGIFRGDGRLAPLKSLVSRFIKAVRANKKFSPNFCHGVRVQKLIEAAQLSNKKSRWVKV